MAYTCRHLVHSEQDEWAEAEGSASPDQQQNQREYCMERAYDWLEADDPALFSDEFSEPEDWGMM